MVQVISNLPVYVYREKKRVSKYSKMLKMVNLDKGWIQEFFALFLQFSLSLKLFQNKMVTKESKGQSKNALLPLQ